VPRASSEKRRCSGPRAAGTGWHRDELLYRGGQERAGKVRLLDPPVITGASSYRVSHPRENSSISTRAMRRCALRTVATVSLSFFRRRPMLRHVEHVIRTAPCDLGPHGGSETPRRLALRLRMRDLQSHVRAGRSALLRGWVPRGMSPTVPTTRNCSRCSAPQRLVPTCARTRCVCPLAVVRVVLDPPSFRSRRLAVHGTVLRRSDEDLTGTRYHDVAVPRFSYGEWSLGPGP